MFMVRKVKQTSSLLKLLKQDPCLLYGTGIKFSSNDNLQLFQKYHPLRFTVSIRHKLIKIHTACQL